MLKADADDVDVAEIARGLNSSRTRKRILVLGAMVASFAAFVLFMLFAYSHP